MKAVVITAFGSPDVLALRDVPVPQPGPRDVLVRVRAAGVCHHDLLHRAGRLPGARTGVTPGHETAGEVVEVGAQVTGRAVGDRVTIYQRGYCGICRNCLRGRHDMCRAADVPAAHSVGGQAEFVCVPEGMAIAVADDIGWEAAAMAVCPIGTGVRALRGIANVAPGDTVLVTGASGGLGVHQIQIARALGARVIAVTSSAGKAATLTSLGADEVVVAPDLAFSKQVWQLTAKAGVDAAIDNLGSTLPETLRCMAAGGIAVVLGNIAGEPVPVLPAALIGRRIRIAGCGMPTIEDVQHALALLQRRLLRPVVAAAMPMADVARAHAMLEGRAVEGRVILQGF